MKLALKADRLAILMGAGLVNLVKYIAMLGSVVIDRVGARKLS